MGNPALFQPECRTPHQMRMANGLCRFRQGALTDNPSDLTPDRGGTVHLPASTLPDVRIP